MTNLVYVKWSLGFEGNCDPEKSAKVFSKVEALVVELVRRNDLKVLGLVANVADLAHDEEGIFGHAVHDCAPCAVFVLFY